MAIEITERWSESRYKRGDSATRAFDITGATDAEAARVALADAPFLVTKGSLLLLDNRLKADEPDISVYAPVAQGYRAIVQYARQRPGESDNDSDNPLDEEPEWIPDFAESTEAFDVDADGAPVVNSAGDPFDTDPTRETDEIGLTYVRNESSYNLAKAIAFKNKTNAGTFNFPYAGSVAAGQAQCKGIFLVVGLKPSADFARVAYKFKVCEKGFRTRILDKGYNGWYNDGGLKSGKFIDGEGIRSRPVLLDGTGKPSDSTILIEKGRTPVAYQSTNPDYLEDTGAGKFWKYKRYKSISFAGLNLT